MTTEFDSFHIALTEIREWLPPSYRKQHQHENSVFKYEKKIESYLNDWLDGLLFTSRLDQTSHPKIRSILLRVWYDATKRSMAKLSVERQILEDSINETKDFVLKMESEYKRCVFEYERNVEELSEIKQQMQVLLEKNKLLETEVKTLPHYESSLRLMRNKIDGLQGRRILQDKTILEQAELIRHYMRLTTCSLYERQDLIRKTKPKSVKYDGHYFCDLD